MADKYIENTPDLEKWIRMTNVNLKTNREISNKVYLNHLFLILLNIPLRLPVFLQHVRKSVSWSAKQFIRLDFASPARIL